MSRSTPEHFKTGGVWWMDFETLHNIHQRFLATGPSATAKQSRGPGAASRSTYREWLALTFEWNGIEQIVIAQLAARLDSYAGVGRLAQGTGANGLDTRAFGMPPHLSKLFGVKQHCVPELWVHEKQAFPRPRLVPFSRLEDVVAGRLA